MRELLIGHDGNPILADIANSQLRVREFSANDGGACSPLTQGFALARGTGVAGAAMALAPDGSLRTAVSTLLRTNPHQCVTGAVQVTGLGVNPCPLLCNGFERAP